MDKNPWKRVKTRPIYSSPWIRVREDDVIRPDGKPGIYSVVELKGGIGVVPIADENRIYLVGQYRYAPNIYSWEIPKGAFEEFASSENPLDTAMRELREETGLTALEWTPLATVHTLLGSTNDRVFLFMAQGLSQGPASPGDTEDLETKTVAIDEFLDMMSAGLITDATSIAAVFLALRRLGQQ